MGSEPVQVRESRPSEHAASTRASRIALWIGILLFVCTLVFGNLDPENAKVTRTAAVALLMACWWIGEAVPLAVTALLPVVLFPLLGVLSSKQVAPKYFDDNVFLYVGGFMVALAMERWNLHQRIALRILLWFGTRPRRILLGFMAATAFVSMWVSNTAATMMMVPIAVALLAKLEERQNAAAVRELSVAVLLGIAYSASIGGVATLVGTPTNLTLGSILANTFGQAPSISFVRWFAVGFPLALVMLGVAWGLLSLFYVPRGQRLTIDRQMLQAEYDALGPLSFVEKVILIDACLLVALWLTRSDLAIGPVSFLGWGSLLQPRGSSLTDFVSDGGVSIAAAIPLFLIPSRPGSSTPIMDWHTAVKLPWDVVLLFGGGFALAEGVSASGLSQWLGLELAAAKALPPFVMLLVLSLAVIFLTELTSNVATSQTLLPVAAAMAVAIGIHPLFLMMPVTIASSLGFMMPAGTPPNAIVFGTRRVTIAQMARTGLALNLVGAVLLTVVMYTLGMAVWGIDLQEMPSWAKPSAPLTPAGK